MSNKQQQAEMILVDRYITLLKDVKPDLVPIKNKEGSLELSHILWMLHKMKEPSFNPLTTVSAWISWIQASLYKHNLIIIRHEKDITRDLMKR